MASQSTRRVRLDDEQRCILRALADAADDGQGVLVHVGELQKLSGVLWIRGPLDSLKRRDLVDHNGALPLDARYWKITDAGRAAIA